MYEKLKNTTEMLANNKYYYLLAIPLIVAIYNYFNIKTSVTIFVSSFIVALIISGWFHKTTEEIKDNGRFPFKSYYFFGILQIVAIHFFILLMIAVSMGDTNNYDRTSGAFLSFAMFFLLPFIFLALIGKINDWYKQTNGIDSNFVENFVRNQYTSFLNPKHLLRGFKWSDLDSLKLDLNGEVYIDNMQLIEKREKYTKKELEKVENVDLKFKRKDFTKTTLAIGKAGSGKTEFFLNLASQNKSFQNFNRELYHDVKGDFTSKLYNPKTDYILNLFDERGLNWDIWEDMKHNENIVVSFLQNLIISQVKEADFWTSSASKVLIDLFLKTHYKNTEKSSKEKWQILVDSINEYKDNINDDKTKQSIYQTMELALNTIFLMAFDGIKSNKRAFSLYEWCNTDKSRLFLLNNASYSKSLTPYFTGFLASLIEILLSKKDISDTNLDLTLMILDEYLSLKLDEDVRLKLLTQIRSKGGCVVIGVQYLDANDKKQKQLVGSSTYAKLLFNVSDDETVSTFTRAYGNVEYEKHKISTSTSNSRSSGANGSNSTSTSTSRSVEDKNLPFLTPEIIKGLSHFRHLTLIDEKQLFYCGYTRKVELAEKNQHFIKADLNKFYKWKLENEDLRDENEDETAKFLSLDVTEKLKIYSDLKEALAKNDNDFMIEIINKHNLENCDIDKFIEDFERE